MYMNNGTYFGLQVASSPSKLRFEANLVREDSHSTKALKRQG